MGTPLYMSPEQCGGGYVDTRSDIYSLGVIAYQMLAGEPPFAGNTSTVMRAHREQTPKHLRESANKIPKRAAGVVMSALSKNPAERPQTAFAFASALRGHSEGVGALYRRAFSLYSEYFPKFLKLSLIAHAPVIVTTILLIAVFIAEKYWGHGGLAQKIVLLLIDAHSRPVADCCVHGNRRGYFGCDCRNHHATVGGAFAPGEAARCLWSAAPALASISQDDDSCHAADLDWICAANRSGHHYAWSVTHSMLRLY